MKAIKDLQEAVKARENGTQRALSEICRVLIELNDRVARLEGIAGIRKKKNYSSSYKEELKERKKVSYRLPDGTTFEDWEKI